MGDRKKLFSWGHYEQVGCLGWNPLSRNVLTRGSNNIRQGKPFKINLRFVQKTIKCEGECHCLGKQDKDDERDCDYLTVQILKDDNLIFINIFNLKMPPLIKA